MSDNSDRADMAASALPTPIDLTEVSLRDLRSAKGSALGEAIARAVSEAPAVDEVAAVGFQSAM